MAKQVVQVACNALALGFRGETLDLGIRTLQKRIGSCLLGERKIAEPKNNTDEKGAFVSGKRATEVPGLRRDSGHHRNQHQDQRAQSSDEKAKHRKGVNKHSIGFLAERVIEKGMEEEQHKRHCLPAPRKLGDKKVEDEEHRVKNRKFCPDRKGVPV